MALRGVRRRHKRRAERQRLRDERKLDKVVRKAQRQQKAAELGVDESEVLKSGVDRIGGTLGAVGGAVGQALGGGAAAATEGSLSAAVPYALGGAALVAVLFFVTKGS